MNSVTLVARRGDDIRAYTIIERFVSILVVLEGRAQAWGREYPTRQDAEQYMWLEADQLDKGGWTMEDPIFRELVAGDIAALTLLDPVKPSAIGKSLYDLMMGDS